MEEEGQPYTLKFDNVRPAAGFSREDSFLTVGDPHRYIHVNDKNNNRVCSYVFPRSELDFADLGSFRIKTRDNEIDISSAELKKSLSEYRKVFEKEYKKFFDAREDKSYPRFPGGHFRYYKWSKEFDPTELKNGLAGQIFADFLGEILNAKDQDILAKPGGFTQYIDGHILAMRDEIARVKEENPNFWQRRVRGKTAAEPAEYAEYIEEHPSVTERRKDQANYEGRS